MLAALPLEGYTLYERNATLAKKARAVLAPHGRGFVVHESDVEEGDSFADSLPTVAQPDIWVCSGSVLCGHVGRRDKALRTLRVPLLCRVLYRAALNKGAQVSRESYARLLLLLLLLLPKYLRTPLSLSRTRVSRVKFGALSSVSGLSKSSSLRTRSRPAELSSSPASPPRRSAGVPRLARARACALE